MPDTKSTEERRKELREELKKENKARSADKLLDAIEQKALETLSPTVGALISALISAALGHVEDNETKEKLRLLLIKENLLLVAAISSDLIETYLDKIKPEEDEKTSLALIEMSIKLKNEMNTSAAKKKATYNPNDVTVDPPKENN